MPRLAIAHLLQLLKEIPLSLTGSTLLGLSSKDVYLALDSLRCANPDIAGIPTSIF
jgi:hypothetical protein